MDPLSQVLELLDLRAASPSRLEAGGRWALSFPGHQHLKIGAVVAGECWLRPEHAAPLHLAAGDCYLLASSHPFTAASDELATSPVPSSTVLPSPWPTPAYYQTSSDDPGRTILISGSLSFNDTAAALLLDRLPPVSRIAAGTAQAPVVAPALRLLAEETAGDAPGSAIMCKELTCILFIQVLRALLEAGDPASEAGEAGEAGEAAGPAAHGWLAALGDQQIGAALTLIHQDPVRRWTVADLAAAVSMSRSSFALRFRALVGLPPLDYLVRWRIQLAARTLQTTDRTVAAIGADLGYTSESAFSNAFKRVRGQPPSRYRQASASADRGEQDQGDGGDGQQAVRDDDRHREVPFRGNGPLARQ
jgi:AraC-like DNA-binding protein